MATTYTVLGKLVELVTGDGNATVARVQKWQSEKGSKGITIDVRDLFEKDGEMLPTHRGYGMTVATAKALHKALPALITAAEKAEKEIAKTAKPKNGKIKTVKLSPEMNALVKAGILTTEQAIAASQA